MNAHSRTSEQSRGICNIIVENLNKDGSVPVKHANSMCSIGSNPVLLYLYHQKSGATIYLYCELSDFDNIGRITNYSIKLETRKSLGSDWAKITPYFMRVRSLQEAQLVPPIYRYLASKPRGTKSPREKTIYVSPSEDGAGARDEGQRITIIVNRYERDTKNRSECIKIFKAICTVCGFDFGETYGMIGKGFIHVHHLRPLSESPGKRKIVPQHDLRPVCPNCHEMLHKRIPPFTIEEMKQIIRGNKDLRESGTLAGSSNL